MSTNPEISAVMRQLECRILPMMPRHERIHYMVDHANPNTNWGGIVTKSLRRFRENPKKTDFREQFGDDLTAFLFFKNRERYNPATYDLEKEKRQIKAVTAFLEGKHIHMGTREGKTSTVFPITSIVDALTSEIGSSLLVGSDEVLLGKLKKHAQFFTDALSGISPELQLGFENKKSERGDKGLGKDSKDRMIRETILGEGFSEETRANIRDTYWKESVESDRYEDPEPKRNTIYLGTDRDAVFEHAEDPEKFMKETGNIYFDEADVPYGRRSPYSTIDENQYYAPSEMEDSIVEWMRRFIVFRQINPDKFVVSDSGYDLPGRDSARLRRLRISKEVSDIGQSRGSGVRDAFMEGVEIISRKMGFNQSEEKQLARNLQSKMIEYESEHPDSDYEKIGTDLARLHKKKGLLYTMEGGVPKVRDSYIDQMLHDHKFSSNEQLNILAMEGEFDFVPLNPVAFKTTSFQSFAKAMGNKLHCASGTLMFPDPETHKISSSAFASFLKASTGNDIEVISPPTIKSVPDARVSATEKESIDGLINSIPDKPTLIVSYHLDNSSEIYRQLVRKIGIEEFNRIAGDKRPKDQKDIDALIDQLGRAKVAYVRSKPSDPGELEAYERESEKTYSDLAEGKLRVVVSSGAAGFGVDIVKNDGSFPDLHVALHDLPTNRAQLMQIFGRRGAPGDDFSWHVSEEFLEPYIMLFEERSGLIQNALGNWDRDEVRRQIKDAIKDPKNSRTLMLKILRNSEAAESQDDEMTILMDQYTDKLGTAIKRSVRDKLIGLPGIINEAQEGNRDGAGLNKHELELMKKKNGIFSVLSMTDEEFEAYRQALSDKDIEALHENLGKNAKQAAVILNKLLPGLDDLTGSIQDLLVGMSTSNNTERVKERLTKLRSIILERGWDGASEQDATFLSALMGVPGGMKEFVSSFRALVPPEVQSKDPRFQVLSLNRYLLDHGQIDSYANSWYGYRSQILTGFRDTVKENGTLYLHAKLDPTMRQEFAEVKDDPEVKGISWGILTVWEGKKFQRFVAYKKENDTFFLQSEDGDALSYPSLDELRNAFQKIFSEKTYNLYRSGYSFLTN